ncbi:MAG TPA: sigma-70 family RNA polymerase sigma factor [Dehalococcoidia bacterium]|nr:sigma-70 family RNA polymerase sigma factor [Dehalococcoidia bacterium]
MSETEEKLVAEAAQGNLAAFNVLIERYQSSVYNLCLRLLANREAAEDAAQESFLAAFRNLQRFRAGNFRAWLHRIAANTCYDELRRRKTRWTQPLAEPASLSLASTGASPVEIAEAAELRKHLEAGLLTLPFDLRLAVVLRDVQGFSYEEVAAIMGVSLGTAKSRISRGRERMRRFLLKQGELLPERFRHINK